MAEVWSVNDNQKKQPRYYIVDRDEFGVFGDENGYDTLEEANSNYRGCENLDVVIIKGTILKRVGEFADEPE